MPDILKYKKWKLFQLQRLVFKSKYVISLLYEYHRCLNKLNKYEHSIQSYFSFQYVEGDMALSSTGKQNTNCGFQDSVKDGETSHGNWVLSREVQADDSCWSI